MSWKSTSLLSSRRPSQHPRNAPACSTGSLPNRISDRQTVRNPSHLSETPLPVSVRVSYKRKLVPKQELALQSKRLMKRMKSGPDPPGLWILKTSPSVSWWVTSSPCCIRHLKTQHRASTEELAHQMQSETCGAPQEPTMSSPFHSSLERLFSKRQESCKVITMSR